MLNNSLLVVNLWVIRLPTATVAYRDTLINRRCAERKRPNRTQSARRDTSRQHIVQQRTNQSSNCQQPAQEQQKLALVEFEEMNLLRGVGTVGRTVVCGSMEVRMDNIGVIHNMRVGKHGNIRVVHTEQHRQHTRYRFTHILFPISHCFSFLQKLYRTIVILSCCRESIVSLSRVNSPDSRTIK